MDRELLAQQLCALPIVQYEFFETSDLLFSDRVRHICRTECPQYGKSWACPPGVGTLEACRERWRRRAVPWAPPWWSGTCFSTPPPG